MNKEIERIKYFIPSILKDVEITQDDEKIFAEFSERGKHPPLIERKYLEVFGQKNCFVKPDGKFLWDGLVINSVLFNKQKVNGWMVLMEAKSWQGIHMQMWEDGVLDGVGYWCLLGGEDGNIMPRNIVDFMKKEMFKGIDKDLIEDTYQKILKQWTPKKIPPKNLWGKVMNIIRIKSFLKDLWICLLYIFRLRT